MTNRCAHARAGLTAAIFSTLLLATPLLADGIDYSFAANAGEELKISAVGAAIKIGTRSRSEVSIQIRRRGDSESRIRSHYDIEARQEDGRVVLEIERKRRLKGLFGPFGGRTLEIDVEVPRRFDVDVSTSGGSIGIADLEGRVRARTSGGGLKLGSINGPIDARTSGGSVNIEACNGGTKVTTSGGSIHIDEVRGAIDASTSGGSIEAYVGAQPLADSSLRTSGGSVKIYLEKNVGVDLWARTSGGRIHNDFDILMAAGGSTSRSRLEGAINGGGPLLELRASGGSIYVRRP